MANDAYPWVKFSFYPCPVGASDPSGCDKNPGPFPGVNPNCCLNDKFEDCLVQQLQCFNTSSCSFTAQYKLAKFLYCFEGSVISEGQCSSDALNCTKFAGIDDIFPAVQACVKDPTQMAHAASAMDGACARMKIKSWPTVLINNVLTCEDDSCFIPLLPKLCDAYTSTPKPRSCQKLLAL